VEVAPTLSVVIPCYNEARYLPHTLTALAAQTLPATEILLVDGGSDDGTVELALALAAELDLPLRVLTNPDRHIPHALNIGIAAATGRFIARLDGHSQPAADYLAACLAARIESGADLVGGAWRVEPGAATATAQAIAIAARTPLGSGGAAYRDEGAVAHDADTVPFGFFEKALWTTLGGYNETLHTNEDYEFALRVRRAGGRVRFDPRIRCVYFARSDFAALAEQYWRYGVWKGRMLRQHPRSLRPRQALPPLLAAGTAALLLASLVSPKGRRLTLAALGLYGIMVAIEAAQQTQTSGSLWTRLSAAYAIMHYTWGLGAWVGLFVPHRKPE
jgi:glycosyltransferase involved in cell wall biosynthesis